MKAEESGRRQELEGEPACGAPQQYGIFRSIGLYMKNKTFPFQARLGDSKINAINFLDMLNCFESFDSIPEKVKNLAHFNDIEFLKKVGLIEFLDVFVASETGDSWPLGNFYGGKENLYLTFFIKFLRNLLKSSEFDRAKELLENEFQCINAELIYQDNNISELFLSVQDSILKTGKADESLMSILWELILDNDLLNLSKEDNEKWQYMCCLLFKLIPRDFDQLCKIFEKLNSSVNNGKLKTCYSMIIHYGMKMLTYSTIYKNSVDPIAVGEVRRYAELFSTALDLLHFLPVPAETYTTKASGLVVLALIKTAYGLGAIEREKEFYSKEALNVMSSFGVSHTMNEAFKLKYEKCEKLVQEAEGLWKAGDKRLHNEMADYLLEKYQPKKEGKDKKKDKHLVSKTLLLERLKEVAQKYGRVRGVKKQ